MSMSTTFHRGMVHDGRSPDLILVSLDAVYFHVHINVLHDASGNGFASLLEQLSSTRASSEVSLINVPESAETLNVVLLTIYDKSSADYRPSFEVLVTAVNEFEKYAIDPRRYVKPSLPLFELIRFHMPLHPLEVYSVAGHYELHELAVAASSHLLGYKLNTITDETVSFMGPLYVLVLPPEPHPSISSCSLMDQTKVARAWALSSAYLIWDVRPDMSASFIENTLSQLKQSMACNSCKKRIDERIKRCVIDWSSVKWTI
ncbi:hypothetical protein CPB85DRAFT_1278389 [Mucidula mucida]|nr:hypothetical protein CPB85DRAFT_1278389 [Mucidula mucida]